MALQYRAAVLHEAQTPMSIETVTAEPLKPQGNLQPTGRPYDDRNDNNNNYRPAR